MDTLEPTPLTPSQIEARRKALGEELSGLELQRRMLEIEEANQQKKQKAALMRLKELGVENPDDLGPAIIESEATVTRLLDELEKAKTKMEQAIADAEKATREEA